jgi:hypothetical protein
VIRYTELTPARLACLKAVQRAHICMDHEDPALLPFLDDNSTLSAPDIFNQCHNAGWLKSWHNSRSDSSFVELTDHGRQALDAVSSPVNPGGENG